MLYYIKMFKLFKIVYNNCSGKVITSKCHIIKKYNIMQTFDKLF